MLHKQEHGRFKNIEWTAYETVHKKYLSLGKCYWNRMEKITIITIMFVHNTKPRNCFQIRNRNWKVITGLTSYRFGWIWCRSCTNPATMYRIRIICSNPIYKGWRSSPWVQTHRSPNHSIIFMRFVNIFLKLFLTYRIFSKSIVSIDKKKKIPLIERKLSFGFRSAVPIVVIIIVRFPLRFEFSFSSPLTHPSLTTSNRLRDCCTRQAPAGWICYYSDRLT